MASWTFEQELAALALYLALPSGQCHKNNKEVIALADALGHTPGSIAMKLGNFAHLDPDYHGKGLKGVSDLDRKVMSEYLQNVSATTDKAIEIFEKYSAPEHTLEKTSHNMSFDSETVGADRKTITTTRVNQSHFRNLLLFNYDTHCCISGLGGKTLAGLLIASHIKPWKASNEREKVAPDNGLLLNAFWDKAFDQGLITLNYDYEIVVSGKVPHDTKSEAAIWAYNGNKITLPNHAAPRKEFIEYHNDVVFKG